MIAKRLLLLSASVLLSGCSNLLSQKNAKLAPTKEIAGIGETLTLPAQLRSVYIKKHDESYYSCAEPGPDVALSDTFKFIAGVTRESSISTEDGTTGSSFSGSKKSGYNSDLQTTTTALELAGRTQTVLLAREFLFRTCEAASNGWLSGDEVKASHQKIIDGIVGLIENDKKNADTAKTKAETEGKKADILDAAILNSSTTAFRTSVANFCSTTLIECLEKAGADTKAKAACQSNFINCTK